MNRFAFPILLLLPSIAQAHDAWVQTNTNIVRTGDAVHVDLIHGNEQRDFKIAGKVAVEGSTLDVIGPDGKRFNLKNRLIDTGYAANEGFRTARFAAKLPGLYVVAFKSDQVMSQAAERSINGAKVCFVASPTLDRVVVDNPGFDRPVGHDLELVPVVNPVTPMGPGSPIRVRLLYKGKPAVGEKVSFIPRGATLKAGLDDQSERLTDAKGEAEFEPTEGNYYLLAAHKVEPKQSGTLDGKPYDVTKYSATLTVYVPETCPCCGGVEG